MSDSKMFSICENSWTFYKNSVSPPAFVAQTRVTLQWYLHKADLAISPLLRRLSPCNLACDGIKV